MNTFHNTLVTIDNFIWGPPLLILLVGTGIYFTFRLRIFQLRHLPTALKMVFSKEENQSTGKGDVSSFAALCTALSATIGTGNIVGVATAIKMGGPGALFWMWLAAVFGMATKYAECLLAVKFRKTDSNGQMIGGPMYYIEYGMGNKWLAKLFALFALGVACFGIGTFPQINAIVDSAHLTMNAPAWLTGGILTVLVAVVTLGGIQSIAKVAEKVVPTMAVIYVVSCASVLLFQAEALPAAFQLVISSAFTGTAATGGFIGASIMLAIQSGVARGVFSNESGLGSAPIAAAAAKTDSCVKQGLVSMTGTFFDTVIICTMTGLTLVVTGVWQGDSAGALMTTQAFAIGLGSEQLGPYLVSIGLMFFAFTTILGWNYYGERCVTYLFGTKGVLPYKIIFIALVASGAYMHLDTIWVIADIVNGLMAIPNLIGLIALRHIIIEETQLFFNKQGSNKESNVFNNV
ncbi:sodium:alanine symporter family protein [Aliivibrio finisterrensis]|uniref:Sodium:alanine symporter family protein n=1 Tax=Aliivibrio finisterrensis TaxID=511998 RepID=A0A4V1Z8T8_9GAMM|nr:MULTISPECIES: sodium:alanine symporter family protein [Aliivibrio]MDD9173973.1 sodium:alanine symporter family protein [Aliivibrio sp. S3TY1]MDD9177682.1 sodium:alanine symporter family protein [Aliivibrio sp. A6]MDD9191050.1 sodium:alanine symporter family protein [Aliivibrio sp. S2TY2]RYU46465.1 sodium:alanine symporter family protein [Aliivibrio finisterrensis]RYU51293.1 sodium:alanine symporter family protein [Aliivibrio finisterrensis]